MEMNKNFSLAMLFLIVLAMLGHSCQGQNSQQDYLSVHNAARDRVGVPRMVWNATVATYARNYVTRRLGDCELVHSTNRPYGENLAKGSGDFTARMAVQLWVNERPNYNYGSNSCNGVCGHYTQVVWRTSTQLGCYRARCNNGWWFVSCNYYVPGNVQGRRPY